VLTGARATARACARPSLWAPVAGHTACNTSA
jgi:hypothetical protein